MIRKDLFVLRAIGRFGIINSPQLRKLTKPYMSCTTLYSWLGRLEDEDLIVRRSFIQSKYYGYEITEKALPMVFGAQKKNFVNRKRHEIAHALAVTNTLLDLVHYSKVLGFAVEHELIPENLANFSLSRRPDAIIQIMGSKIPFEIAIEVERSVKGIDRVNALLSEYESIFEKQLLCKAVIIVACTSQVFKSYSERIAKLSGKFEKKILLTTPSGLLSLNENIYGQVLPEIKNKLELLRNDSSGVQGYSPIVSDSYYSGDVHKTDIQGIRSQTII